MKAKRILSIILTAMLLIGVLGACSVETTTTTAGTTTAATTTAGTTAATTTEATTTEGTTEATTTEATTAAPAPHETLANPNVKFIYWVDRASIDTNLQGENYFDRFESAIPVFEEKYGGKVDVIYADWGAMMETMIAMQNAGDAPDLFILSDQTFLSCAMRGIVQPVDDFVAEGDMTFWPGMDKVFFMNGKNYAITVRPYAKHVLFNIDMFEAAGIETPDKIYDRGEWTYDKFEEIAREFTLDTDDDGVIDQWGFGNTGDFFVQVLAANGTSLLDFKDDGIAYNLNNAAAIRALEYFASWTDPETGIMPAFDDSFWDLFDTGKMAMDVGHEIFWYGGNGFEVGAVPYPVGPDNAEKKLFTYPQGLAIPTGSKNPEGAAAFAYLVNKTTVELSPVKERALIEVADKPWRAGTYDRLYKDVIWTYDMSTGISDGWGLFDRIATDLIDGMPPASVVEKYQPEVESLIKLTAEEPEPEE